MAANFTIEDDFIAEQNKKSAEFLAEDYEYLAKKLQRRSVDIENLVEKARNFQVAVPSWGVGTGGSRFARFPGKGEPRGIYEKLDDCATINRLVRSTSAVSLHIPWDKTENTGELKSYGENRGLTFDAMNSNPFQDRIDQQYSYKFGSLSHTDYAVRKQAIEHNIECIKIGKQLGSKALTAWVGDGSNFAGQANFRRSLECYLESVHEIYAAIPDDWRMFIEHKFYEPAFYSTVINDWGTSYICAKELGEKAMSLVDLGHHAPNVNIEQVVSRLIQLFLVFNELIDAKLNNQPNFNPAYMLDQSHNVTDPIESLMMSAIEVTRAFVQAHIVDRAKLETAQRKGDAITALAILKEAFTTDVSPILATARMENGGAIDLVSVYRASSYRFQKDKERPANIGISAGIV